MTTTTIDTTTYPEDLWEDLEATRPRHIPSRQDRDRLVREAEKDPDGDAPRRVRIWDYFFQVRPEHVATRQKEEKERLEQRLPETCRKLENRIEATERRIHELEQAAGEEKLAIRRKQTGVEAEVEERHRQAAGRNLLGAQILGAVAFLCFVPLLGALLGLRIAPDSVGGGLLPGIPLGILAFRQYRRSQRKKSEVRKEVEAEVKRFVEQAEQRISKLRDDIESDRKESEELRSNLERFRKDGQKRLEYLEDNIRTLLSQIPETPTDEQIDEWFRKDVERLAAKAEEKMGLERRLEKVAGGENPFRIFGPAELQYAEDIPPSYRGKDDTRRKHLHARRFALVGGEFADFYGVYKIEFLLLGEDVLATYSTFYDFIRGKQVGEMTRVQHYADIVAINSEESEREIELLSPSGDTDLEFVDSVPTLTISLTSGEAIRVTFPGEDYFKSIAAVHFQSNRWKFDPRQSARNAIKSVRANVDEAKRKREMAAEGGTLEAAMRVA